MRPNHLAVFRDDRLMNQAANEFAVIAVGPEKNTVTVKLRSVDEVE